MLSSAVGCLMIAQASRYGAFALLIIVILACYDLYVCVVAPRLRNAGYSGHWAWVVLVAVIILNRSGSSFISIIPFIWLAFLKPVTIRNVHHTGRVLILLFALSLSVAVSRTVVAADWPDGYVLYEDTQSPDERYGILVPTSEAWEKDGSLEDTNYLADLKNHRILGKIKGADYFEHQNHRGLKAVWAPDSSWCVVEYDGRFSFDNLSILELKDSTFVQTDIGKRIGKALATAIKEEEPSGDVGPQFRIEPGRKLRVQAVLNTDPKELDLKHARYALFIGIYDMNSKKWLNANARAVDREGYDGSETAFSDLESQLKDTSFASANEKAEWLDERMNVVYNFLRVILPPNRFEKLKQEQKNWLKQRDAATSVEEKCKLIEERIKSLQKLAW